MKAETLLNQYLEERHMMQLATLAGDQPWCCTVYFVADSAHNLYWASLPTRRHSQEIAQHNKVAAAIPVKHVKGEAVVGLQFAGTAEQLPASEANRLIVGQYAVKFGRDKQWIEDFVAGNTEHQLYKLTPSEIVMFNEADFPDDPRIKLV